MVGGEVQTVCLTQLFLFTHVTLIIAKQLTEQLRQTKNTIYLKAAQPSRKAHKPFADFSRPRKVDTKGFSRHTRTTRSPASLCSRAQLRRPARLHYRTLVLSYHCRRCRRRLSLCLPKKKQRIAILFIFLSCPLARKSTDVRATLAPIQSGRSSGELSPRRIHVCVCVSARLWP